MLMFCGIMSNNKLIKQLEETYKVFSKKRYEPINNSLWIAEQVHLYWNALLQGIHLSANE